MSTGKERTWAEGHWLSPGQDITDWDYKKRNWTVCYWLYFHNDALWQQCQNISTWHNKLQVKWWVSLAVHSGFVVLLFASQVWFLLRGVDVNSAKQNDQAHQHPGWEALSHIPGTGAGLRPWAGHTRVQLRVIHHHQPSPKHRLLSPCLWPMSSPTVYTLIKLYIIKFS